jgi:hypothetical protein
VSLSDITQLLGTSSVPVVIAGSVLGVFELGEKLASQRAKDAVSKWLLTFEVRRAGALPDVPTSCSRASCTASSPHGMTP